MSPPPTVVIHVPGPLRSYCAGAAQLSISAHTVRAALECLERSQSAIDTRSTPRLYASSCNPFFGMKVLRSTDMGKSLSETKSAPAFPKEDGRALANIWSLEAVDGLSTPALYLGTTTG